MSAEPADSTEEPDTEEPDTEEVPEIDADEQAEISLDELDVDPDEVEEQAGAGPEADGDDAADTEGDDAGEQDTAESDQQAPTPAGETWGDQYVSMLALLLGEIAESTEGKPGKTAEDIEDLARAPPVELDENVDEWLQQAGMGTDIPPGKAVALGTAGLVAVVLLTETDAASDLIDGLSEQLDSDLL
ncbi:hypothetical protein [Haloarcula amylolytica]|uniref:Uncharacterized protein n=1 Tax=Haloarcula amylolytica JCM 13557 TaxID=1227452 RepID=M0KPK5_9EURY|nr:hypothetical protein [Haloarcula amylolytica]EMA23101.1 hypothetical protein C442_08746 [Haloarcula amylolytica JCM 13557]